MTRVLSRALFAVATFVAVATLPALVLGAGFAGPSSDLGLARLLAHGSLLAFLVAFGGGVLTSLTPCVYPLIPITVAIFGAKKETSRSRAAALSGLYVLGIAATYSALGAVASLTGRAFGSAMQSPWMIGAVALVFTVMAASMFGAFDLALPAGLQARLSTVGGAGFAGAFAMGLVAGVVAAPCTGPVLTSALAYVATRGSVAFGVGIMFTYALGIGLLFFAIGVFSVSLPKSGPWMETIKGIFGVAMLAAAGVFLAGLFPSVKSLFSAARIAAFAAAGVAAVGVLLGALHGSFSGRRLEKLAKALGLVLAVGGIVYAIGAGGARVRAGLESQIAWMKSEPEALALAKAKGRPVAIDFWADWCVACKELDRTAWSDPRVQEEMKRFVAVKVDGTVENEPFDRAFDKYRAIGMPTVIFIDSRGRELPQRIFGVVGADEMLEKLRAVDQVCVAAMPCATRW